jgi:hypothetical protein
MDFVSIARKAVWMTERSEIRALTPAELHMLDKTCTDTGDMNTK